MGKVLEIHSKTGIIVPIRTPICPRCRKSLYEDPAESSSENKNLPGNGLNGEYNLRPNRLASVYMLEEHASISSQESSDLDSYCNSQGTDTSAVRVDKLQKLNEFLDVCDISPVKFLRDSLENSSERTKRRYLSKATDCVTAVLKTICPEDYNFIRKSLFGEINVAEKDTSNSLLEAIASSYMNANTCTLRRQLLSIATNDYSFAEVNALLPCLSRYKFYTAKKQRLEAGLGIPIEPSLVPRSKINDVQLDHFLDFITSSHLIKDLPLGEKMLQLSTGEIIQTPNVIRSLAPATIIRQYTQLCAEENIKPLGTSTMYKILTDCSASVRQSMQGIDYYVSEGTQAFSDLTAIVEDLDLTIDEKKKTLDNLIAAKHYLKTDFKLHVNTTSSVADHCCSFALSEEKGAFSKTCVDHLHTEECQQCHSVDNALLFMSEKVEERHWDNPEAILFKVEKAIESIYEWKGHILRSKNQERSRQDIINSLGEKEALVVADWAMKFLPRKYREGQTDWYGKRGVNWHITYTITRMGGFVTNVTHVHIFEEPISQDAATTAALLIDVCSSLSEVNQIHLYSDNAGCYKSTTTMTLLHQELGKKLKSYNFCEAQDGKGPCDRKASHMKSAIKRHVNEGNDVISAQQMKKAIDSQQTGLCKVKVISQIIDAEPAHVTLKSIPSISTLHNFQFTEEGLRIWRAFEIGPGKTIPWDNICSKKIPVMQFYVHLDWSSTEFMPAEPKADDRDSDDDSNDNDSADDESRDGNDEGSSIMPASKRRRTMSKIFSCPEEGCSRKFKNSKSLDKHIMTGNCNIKEEKLSLPDRSKILYSEKLEGRTEILFTKQSTKTTNTENSKLKKGWALKVHKAKTVFTEDQKCYLQEKFNTGKSTGRKEDPSKVAEEMRYVKRNGVNRFPRSQFLTSQQIASFFSRLAQKDKRLNEEDLEAADVDSKRAKLKQDILEKCTYV